MGVFTWGGYEPKEEEKVCKDKTCESQDEKDRLEMEEVNKRIEAEFYAYEQEEELERQKLRNYDSGVTVKKFSAGDFICVGKHEIPRKYIESINVLYTGSPPYKKLRGKEYYRYMELDRVEQSQKYYYGHYKQMASLEDGKACKGEPAQISIKMASGASVNLSCHRLAVDFFLDALNTAWKHTEAK